MRFVKSSYEGNDTELKIIPSGDWHVGHVNFDESIVDTQFINKLSYTTRGLLLGDLLECATKTSIGKGLFDTNMTIAKQKEFVLEKLRPVAQYIDGCVIGNHESRVEELTSIDILSDICRELKIPYFKYMGYVKHAWNKKAYVTRIWHGAGQGSATGTAIRQCEEQGKRGVADIYAIGHFHKLCKSDKIVEMPDLYNMNIRKITQHYITIGGSLKIEEGYADQKGLEERTMGFPVLTLDGRINYPKKVKVELLIKNH